MIRLSQILRFFEKDTRIQIVTYGIDWNAAVEMSAGDILLYPFYDYLVTDLASEESYKDGTPIIRVSIEENKDFDEEELQSYFNHSKMRFMPCNCKQAA